MKNFNLILCMLVMSMSAYTQEDYNKFSMETEFGATKIRDATSVEPYNIDLAFRYMANTLFGVKVNFNYTDINNLHFMDNQSLQYVAAGFHGVVNFGRLLQFESFTKKYTILGGIGGTYTHSGDVTNEAILHRISNFHLSAFVDNEFKLSKHIFGKIGLDVQTGVNSRPFIKAPSTQTTSILNFNIGFVFTLKNGKEHADWYLEEHIPVIDTIVMQPTIIDKTITTTEYDCNCDANSDEYVFFDNDKHEVNRDGLNGIIKIASILFDNDKTVRITGFASPPATDKYNLELATKRCNDVKDKLISLGIEEHRIIINPIGETDTHDSKNFDLARRVLLEIE